MRSFRLRAFVRAAVFSTAVLAGTTLPRSARADEPTPAALAQAREEYRRGIALEAAGDWEGALVVFKGVALVKSTPQVRFHIAQAEEKIGDLVQSLGSYRLALFEAREAKVKDVEAASARAIAAIEPKIPKLTIVRGTGAGVAKVVLDGRELGPASIGTPISINPGPHNVQASAQGHETINIEVTLGPGETKDVGISLREVKSKESPLGPSSGPIRDSADPRQKGTSGVRIAGYIIGGAGIASLGVAGAFLGIRQSAIADLDAECGPGGKSCPASAAPTRDRGEMASTVFTGTLIGGAAGVVIGGIMIIAGGKKNPPSSQRALVVMPIVSPGTGGANVFGRF